MLPRSVPGVFPFLVLVEVRPKGHDISHNMSHGIGHGIGGVTGLSEGVLGMVFRRGRDRSTEPSPDSGSGADARALSEVVATLQDLLDHPGDDLRPLLEVVRVAFGMDYASSWAPAAVGRDGVPPPRPDRWARSSRH